MNKWSDQDSPTQNLVQGNRQIEIANRTYSEIRMEQIVNDTDFDYASILDEHCSRAKVIPTQNINQTVICRNTIEMKYNKKGIFEKCFGRKDKKQVTMRQIIDIRQKELLNDYAYETEKEGLIPKVQNYFCSFRVIEPDSLFYILWQVLNSILVILFFFEIPFMLAYQPLLSDARHIQIFEEVTLDIAISIFIIDILITFSTGYFKQGQLITNRGSIARNYIKTYFLLDLIPLLCLIEYRVLLYGVRQFNFELLLFILKMYEVMKTSNMVNEYLQLEPSKLARYRFLTVMLTIIWLCHVFACLFFLVGRIKLEKNNYIDENQQINYSWLTESELITLNIQSDQDYKNLPVSDLFLYSFYWAVTTMISVGYGDICPKNAPEVLITVTTQFISCIVFAYSVNAIWEMINQQTESKSKFQKYVNAIERFMREHNVNRQLKAKIEAYLFHLWQSEKARDYELEQAMIQKLAPALREELIYQTFGTLFNQNRLFAQFSENLKVELASEINQVYFSQDEILFAEGEEVDDFPIFYLVKGSIEIYLNNEKQIRLHVMKSGIIGIIGFITGYKRTASAKCLSYSVVYKLSRLSFLKKLESFPKDKELFYQIRHQLLFNNEFDYSYKLKCYICESKKHLAIHCNKTLFIPQKKAIIMEAFQAKNERVPAFQRRIVKQQYKALPHVREVQCNANAIRKYFNNISFNDDSSNEDNEYSSDVDDYIEEMQDIKKLVEQEKYKAQQRKQQNWVADDDYEMKVEEKESFEVNAEAELLKQSQQLIKNSDDEEVKKKNKKQKKHLSFVQIHRNMRTSSMSSLTPIQEIKPQISQQAIQRKKTENNIQLRKHSKILQNTEIQNLEKSMQSNDKIVSPDKLMENRKQELLRKMKTITIAQPKNQEIQGIVEELRQFIQSQSVISIPKEIIPAKNQENQDLNDFKSESEFSIDQMENFSNFFIEDNPEKVLQKIRRSRKEKFKQRRTTFQRQYEEYKFDYT